MFCALTLAVSGLVAPLASWSAGSAMGTTPQTIAFAPIPDRTLLDPALVLSAGSTSGLDVAFKSLTGDVCSIDPRDGKTLSPEIEGVCTVEADQGGNETFAPAPPVLQSFNVTKATQTITFAPLPDVPLSAGVVQVSATTSRHGKVVFTAGPGSVCATDDTYGEIKLVGAGTCTVNADQPGTTLVAPAPTVSRSFGVGRTAQAITFAVIPGHSVLDPPITLTASASSLLPVTFTVPSTTSVCTAGGPNGATVTLHSAGTCSVEADQAGNDSFSAAPAITQSFNVTLAPQTITFAALTSKTVLQTPVSVGATASSGLAVVVTTTTPGVCTAGGTNGTTITLVGAGTCTVAADQAGNATYAPADTAFQSFSVTKVDQTITFGPIADHSLEQTPVSLGATASSTLPVVFTSINTAVCTVTGTGITLLVTGTCTIEADQSGNGTYNRAPAVQQSFTITKVDQTIDFPPLSDVAINASITATATATSGLPVTFSTSTPSACSSTGTNGSVITRLTSGTCTVEADQPGDATYNAAPAASRTLGAVKTNQTITFAAVPNTTLGHSPVTVSATASSHLVVTFTTTTPSVCRTGGPSGAEITLLRAGTCAVRATQLGNGTYAPAPAVTRQFTIAEPVVTASESGYWMLGADGHVYAFGSAPNFGSASDPAVALAARRDGAGYWVVDRAGNVHAFGRAAYFGGHPPVLSGESVSTLSATPSGNGYWLFTTRGRAFPYGDAHFFGDLRAVHLNGPVIASVATPTGHGYYMVASDGGVFSFGDARFHGSMGGTHLNRPIVGLSPTPDNRGYWLVGSDGGVFAFGAPFRGSLGNTVLNEPVNGLVAYGNGYLMVASDGGVFDFSNKKFVGSLGNNPPAAPIVGIATNGAA